MEPTRVSSLRNRYSSLWQTKTSNIPSSSSIRTGIKSRADNLSKTFKERQPKWKMIKSFKFRSSEVETVPSDASLVSLTYNTILPTTSASISKTDEKEQEQEMPQEQEQEVQQKEQEQEQEQKQEQKQWVPQRQRQKQEQHDSMPIVLEQEQVQEQEVQHVSMPIVLEDIDPSLFLNIEIKNDEDMQVVTGSDMITLGQSKRYTPLFEKKTSARSFRSKR